MKLKIYQIILIVIIAILIISTSLGYRFTVTVYKLPTIKETPQKVTFDGVINDLNRNFEWSVENQKEYVLCMYGTVDEDSYIINEVSQPEIEEATSMYVVFKGCEPKIGKQFLGMIHSHIGKEGGTICQQSLTDIYYFGFTSARTGAVLNCVQCGESTFGCFTPNSLWQRLNYEIK